MTAPNASGRVLRSALILTLLAATVAQATAVWVVVARNEKFTTYADPASMRKEGGIVRMWDLLDYKNAQGGAARKPYLSATRHHEYDCKGHRSRLLAVALHAENLAKGEVVAGGNVKENWVIVAENSADELLLMFACGK